MTGVFLKEEIWTQTCTEKRPWETHGEDGHLRFKDRGCRRNQACQRLDFRLLASRTVKVSIPIVLSYKVCSNLLWQPKESNNTTYINQSVMKDGGREYQADLQC